MEKDFIEFAQVEHETQKCTKASLKGGGYEVVLKSNPQPNLEVEPKASDDVLPLLRQNKCSHLLEPKQDAGSGDSKFEVSMLPQNTKVPPSIQTKSTNTTPSPLSRSMEQKLDI